MKNTSNEMETDNYLQTIRKPPENIITLPPEMMPKTKEQSVLILTKWPLQYYAALSPRTVEDAVNSITPELAVFKKKCGETSLYAVMTILINDLIDFFSVGKTMGQNQIVSTIKLIVEDFYYLKIEDFKLCFNNAKRGKYGKVYDRIDGNVIYDWIIQYNQERMDFCMFEDEKNTQSDTEKRLSDIQKENEHDFKLRELIERRLK